MRTPLRRSRLLATLAVLAVWAGSSALIACFRRTGRLPAPIPAAGPRMDHPTHMAQGLECAWCHLDEEHTEAGIPSEPRRPTWAACAYCHEKEDAAAPVEKRIRTRFFDPEGKPLWPKAIGEYIDDVKFRHASHAQTACASCHGTLAGSDRFHGLLFSMESCRACHAQTGALNECRGCHVTMDVDVEPRSHAHLWKQRHGQVSRSERQIAEGRCDVCHDRPTFCDRCHQDEAPANHTNLWRTTTHGITASMDRASCAVCHKTDTCVRCHEETPPRNHGAGWLGGPERHCVACHFPIKRKDQSCGVCHFEEPTHPSAADQPVSHGPGFQKICRECHQEKTGAPGAPPTGHPDNGMACFACHRR
jgi:hypothetical protein